MIISPAGFMRSSFEAKYHAEAKTATMFKNLLYPTPVNATGGDQRPLNAMIFDEGFHRALGLRIAELDNLKFNARGIMFKRLRRENRMPAVCIAHCHSVHAPLPEVVRLKWLTLLRRLGLSRT
jgi:hypothetical protein